MNALEKQFAQMVGRHKSTIYTVCYMFSNDADEVSDLFQEVLVNLWKGFEGFEHRSDVKTWIYRVALNTCISQDRKKRRSAGVPITLDINLFEDSDEERLAYVSWSFDSAGGYAPPEDFQAATVRQGYHPALAGGSFVRGNRTDCRYHCQECQRPSVQNP